MNLCNDNHDEICYEGNSCPVCMWMKYYDKLEGENFSLIGKVELLEAEIRDLVSRTEGV